MSTVQINDQLAAVLAEVFADAPYVKKLGFDALGASVIVRAVFDDDGDYGGRLGEVVGRFWAFEKRIVNGIMPEMDLRMQAVPTRRGWPGGLEDMAVVIDRR